MMSKEVKHGMNMNNMGIDYSMKLLSAFKYFHYELYIVKFGQSLEVVICHCCL